VKTQFLKLSTFILLSLNTFISLNLAANPKNGMIHDLEFVKHLFEVGYAPAEWKKENDGWDLNHEFNNSVLEIQNSKDISLKQYQHIIRNFASSTKDYHVGILFYSTELATLPFRVKTIDKQTFIDWVDYNKLSKEVYSLQQGDELIEFNGVPIQEVMKELLKSGNKNSNELTDQAIADISLTKRAGYKGDTVPKGSLMITFRSKADGKLKTNQLMWEYFPEFVKSPSNLMQTIPNFFPKNKEKKKLTSNYTLFNPIHQMLSAEGEDEGALGSRISFVPILGNPIWVWEGKLEGEETPEIEVPESDYPLWNAYIYENQEGRNIGYIRIPHYVGDEEGAALFGKIIGYMEKNTEALVVDQVNNYGGYVNFCYDLASMLSPEALKTPKHRIKINQEEVFSSLQNVEMIDNLLSTLGNGALQALLKALGIDEPGINYQRLLFLKHFYQFLIDEWNEGRSLTNPIFIDGVDIINPHPINHYTMPILFLINELDFSGGDFMPAILQDNKRVVLFGSRTAGAGGFIARCSFPNKYGIAAIGYTGSIAERDNLQKIESLGVTPDIEYKITADDIQDNYSNYGKTVNEVISDMLPPKVKIEEPVEGDYDRIVYGDEENGDLAK